MPFARLYCSSLTCSCSDIGFPDLNGIEVVRRLAKAAPSVKILMLTMYDDDESILGAVRAGRSRLCAKGRRC